MSGSRAVISLALVVAISAGGCSRDATVHHSEGGGPLSALVGEGTLTARAVTTPTWFAKGAFTLCDKDGGSDIVITGVRTRTSGRAMGVRYSLRTVEESAVEMQSPTEPSSEYVPIQGSTGLPPDLEDPVAGEFTSDISGTRITQVCDDLQRPRHGFTELIFLMKTDSRGARLEQEYIDYTAGGKDYTLETREVVIVCGTAIHTDECP